MATPYWLGTADAVAQVWTATPVNPETGDKYDLLIDSDIVATFTVGATETVQAVCDGLIADWNDSTDPRAEVVTASDEGDAKVTLTSDVDGMPFVVTKDTTNGGAVDDQDITLASTTASAGPHHWDTADNWSTGVVPVNADEVTIENSDVDILWGLDQSAVTIALFNIYQTYTGKIGLDRTQFHTTADAASSVSTRAEYREHYLDIGWDRCDIGEHYGPGPATGSRRLKLDNAHADANDTFIYNTASQSADANLPCVRLLLTNAAANVYVSNAPGGLGIAIDEPGELSTVGTISIAGASSATNVYTGAGTTLSAWEQDSGNNTIDGIIKNGLTTLTCTGGTVTTTPNTGVITTLNVSGGIARINNLGGAAAVVTANLTGGVTDLTQFSYARTWTTVNITENGVLKADGGVLTITTLNEPSSGRYTLSCVA